MTAPDKQSLQPLGTIVHLQVQREKIKSGKGIHERYVPEGILTRVEALVIDPGGVTGIDRDGNEIMDVHNRAHPRSRFRGANGISFLTAGHYEKMRRQYGGHLANGIAAESVLVESETVLNVNDLANGIVIGEGDQSIVIHDWAVAHPCAPFARFATQFPDDAKPDRRLTEALRFLDEGTRGFYGVLPAGIAGKTIRVGDLVSLIR